MDYYYSVGEKQGSREMPHILLLHPRRDLQDPSTDAAVAVAVAVAVPDKVGMDQMDLLAAEPLQPFGRPVEEGRCSIKQMDPPLQMDLGRVLHTQAAAIYMLLHRISC